MALIERCPSTWHMLIERLICAFKEVKVSESLAIDFYNQRYRLR